MNDQHEYLKVTEVLSVRITLDVCGHLMPSMQEAALNTRRRILLARLWWRLLDAERSYIENPPLCR